MYSRAVVIAFAVIAVSAPSVLAAPAPSYNARREVLDHFSRDLAELQARQESGALSWQDVENFGNKVLDGIQQVTPIITQAADIYNKVNGKEKRDELSELLARQESGALSWQDVENFGNDLLNGIQQVTPVITQAADIYNKINGKGKREEAILKLLARQESGALSWQDVENFGNKLLDGIQSVTPIITQAADIYKKVSGKREDLARELHMVARDIIEARDVDQSGALSWQDVKDFGKGFVQGFTKTAETVLPIVGAFVKREDMDLFARELTNAIVARQLQDMESGALSWQDVKDFGKGFVQGFTKTAETVLPIVGAFVKREDVDLISRELAGMHELLARQESGALSWQDVKDFGKGFVQGFTKTVSAGLPIVASLVKKEDLEMLAARQTVDPVSGAISWQDVKDFGKGFVQGFTKTAETVLPIVGAFVKREEMDSLTRDLAHLNDLLAREESGAISWQDVKDFGKGFVQGFTKTVSAGLPIVASLVKKEDMDMLLLARGDMAIVARSLNELD